MTVSAVRYDRWKAPAEDGQSLVWPAPAELIADTRQNHQALASLDSSLRIQNVPVAEVRRKMRQWLGHDDQQLLLATGHQAELHHPGVWAKNALMDAAAEKVGGRAFHFAVDTDEPKHLQLRWPGGAVPLTDDPAHTRAAWSGLLAPPTPAHLQYAADLFNTAAAAWSFKPLAPEFLASLRRIALDAGSLPNALTEALHQLDWSLGLRHDAMLVSPICRADPYLLFVHHLLARADSFAADYNASLEQYRRENKIRSPGRPMPDLKCAADSCEVPFWLDSLATGTRARAAVVRSANQWALRWGDEEFRFGPAADGWSAAQQLALWLGRHGLRLAPRALTLTAVLRMLLADQFVHGIGGGQYDQVLDALIVRHFGFDPPRFSVTTATLYFPEAVGQPRVCLPCLVDEGRKLRHNVLGPKKMEWVRQIDSLPRGSPERSSRFFEMHEKLAATWNHAAAGDWEQRVRDAAVRDARERVLFDRELFYAIQPRDRLEGLIGRYRDHFAE